MMHDTQRQTENTTMNFSEIGKKLGAAIVATAEYKAFSEAELRYRSNTQARELLKQYQEAQQTVQLMRHLSSDATQEEMRLDELQRSLDENQIISGYANAEKALLALLRELNVFISERLNLDFAGLTKPKTGCCG